MLPLKLSINGLYSYQKKQIIDFEELTDAGLFGIFGAVGSGKSSLLEAIGFVLYGETERLNSRDKRAYNMLNLKSNQAFIEFEFLNFEDKKFKFSATWNRNKKRFDETTTIERLAYIWEENQWIPIPSADATPIIGLTYDNFRRTIIIPQGKFKEFLDLKGKDRSDMMKEIFRLERFDLSYKVSALQKDTNSKLDYIKGELSGFENTTEESIKALEKEAEVANGELLKIKTDLSLIDNELKELTVLKTNFEDLDIKRKNQAKLNLEKEAMDALQLEIDLFEKTERNFKAHLIALKTEKIALETTQKQFLFTDNQKKLISESNLKSQTIIDQLKPEFDQLENSKNKVSDLESIEKIRTIKSEVALIEEKSRAEATLFLETEKKEITLIAELATIQHQLTDAKSKKIDNSLLFDLGTWYQQQESLDLKLADHSKKKEIIEKEYHSKTEIFTLLEVPFATWKSVLEAKLQLLSVEKEKAILTRTKLLVSQELVHFAADLHDGENCPLCGSQEHPNVMQGKDVSNQLEICNKAIADFVRQEDEINLKSKKAERVAFEINHIQEQLKTIVSEIESFEKEQKEHLSRFIWKDFDAKNKPLFESKKSEQQLLEKEILALENKEKAIRQEQEKMVVLLKKYNATKAELETEQATKNGAVQNELSQLKVLLFSDYESVAIASIQAEKVAIRNRNLKIAADYQAINDVITKQNQELATLKGSLAMLQIQVAENEKALAETQKTVSELLQEHQFNSVEEVRSILLKNWNLEAEKDKVKLFTVELLTAIKSVSEAEKLITGKTFDADVFDKKTNQFSEFNLQYETQLGKVSSLNSEIQRQTKEFKIKAKLLLDFEKLNSRATNLGILANMFSASGFVNYVSSIYLQNLSDLANARFHRMTKNQLSLCVNASNEFEVIDYLNNGARRSVKTLSGGQGFQASLCLALALAESVQTLNNTNKNFFFIDEGFGTQDPESVAVVFDTLQSLYKENRIVGIISHVAELQERIPRSINVFKDDENGSFVTESWN